MDRATALATFRACVAEVLDVETDEVQLGSRWREDLDADSLAVVEITLALSDAFGVKIPDVEPKDLETVGQAFDLVAQLIPLSGDPAGGATADVPSGS